MSWSAPSVISGVGESELGVVPGRSSHSLMMEAALDAVRDAGLELGDIDGLISIESLVDRRLRHGLNLAQYMGLHSDRLRYITTSSHGSVASGGVGLHEACMAIASGVCTTVLVVSGDPLRSGGRPAEGKKNAGVTMLANNRDAEFENPYGTFIAATWALTASRYMQDFDVTDEDLARVSVAARERASEHPKAQMRDKKITIGDVLESPMLATPLRRLNCSIVSDGACALVVQRADRAPRGGRARVRIAAGETVYGRPGDRMADDMGQVSGSYTAIEGSARSSSRALRAAGLSLADVDVPMQYDPFSHVPLLFLEGWGYCGRGEAGQLVRDGFFDSGPGYGWNPHGGLLGYCHPGNAGGLFMHVEATRQLRGDPLGRRVDGAEVSMIQGYGANKAVFTTTVLTRE